MNSLENYEYKSRVKEEIILELKLQEISYIGKKNIHE